MARQPDTTAADAPQGFTDYVVRFGHAGRDARTQVFRATSEAEAVELALDAIDDGRWAGWHILDMVTVEEAIARRGGQR